MIEERHRRVNSPKSCFATTSSPGRFSLALGAGPGKSALGTRLVSPRRTPIRLMANYTLQHGLLTDWLQYIANNGSATSTMLTFSKITFEILKDREMCLSDYIGRLPVVVQSCFRIQVYSVEL